MPNGPESRPAVRIPEEGWVGAPPGRPESLIGRMHTRRHDCYSIAIQMKWVSLFAYVHI